MKKYQTISALLLSIVSVSITLPVYSDNVKAETKPGRVDIARFDKKQRLIRPNNIDEWVLLGASIGHGYPTEGGKKFSINSPGNIFVVQIEPEAYQYFKANKHYANGTMLSLSFYDTQEKPSPAVNGIVQGALETFEIHLIDKEKYTDTRAFFLYGGGKEAAAMIAEGNTCVKCHHSDAEFDGTFVQFYPVARDHILKSTN